MAAIADYYDGLDAIKEHAGTQDIFKISPSSLSSFFGYTSNWYHEEVLGNEKAFKGSTATHLGTIIHHYCESVAKGEDLGLVGVEVEEFLATIMDPDVDKNIIRELWLGMAELLSSECITPDHKLVSTEEFVYQELLPAIYVGGTYDALRINKGDYSYQEGMENPPLIVRDYKSAGSKPSGIAYNYKLQAYTYAWMLREQGKNITAIELCFIVRPTKTLPARYFEFQEPYTDENHEFIGSILKLVAESVQMFKSNPKMQYLLAQDYRLKDTSTPKVSFPGA